MTSEQLKYAWNIKGAFLLLKIFRLSIILWKIAERSKGNVDSKKKKKRLAVSHVLDTLCEYILHASATTTSLNREK